MAVSCNNCRHYFISQHGGIGYCQHPDAKVFDRVEGYLSPPLSDAWPDAKASALAGCDREGRFERAGRPWLGKWL